MTPQQIVDICREAYDKEVLEWKRSKNASGMVMIYRNEWPSWHKRAKGAHHHETSGPCHKSVTSQEADHIIAQWGWEAAKEAMEHDTRAREKAARIDK